MVLPTPKETKTLKFLFPKRRKKLTVTQEEEVIEKYLGGGIKQYELAKEYKTSVNNIHCILLRHKHRYD